MTERREIEFGGFGAQLISVLAFILFLFSAIGFGVVLDEIREELSRIATVAERAYPVPQEKTCIKKGGEEVCGWAVRK